MEQLAQQRVARNVRDGVTFGWKHILIQGCRRPAGTKTDPSFAVTLKFAMPVARTRSTRRSLPDAVGHGAPAVRRVGVGCDAHEALAALVDLGLVAFRPLLVRRELQAANHPVCGTRLVQLVAVLAGTAQSA